MQLIKQLRKESLKKIVTQVNSSQSEVNKSVGTKARPARPTIARAA